MILLKLLLVLFLGTLGTCHRARCRANDPCWPSPKTWSSFNATISGRLLRTYPSAAPCHAPNYNAQQCATVQQNWTSSFWRTSQPGAYAAILWEVGSGQCFPNTTISTPCDQGLVAEYSVAAESAADITKAVKFANKHNLYLVIKNTGHDHLGRSSGKGSFAIWTHRMKGRVWHEGFIPKNAPQDGKGVKAVTLQAGEQWHEVYADADTHNAIVVGGMARTVGAAGGYLTGGGHSPFANLYGLAVDSTSPPPHIFARCTTNKSRST